MANRSFEPGTERANRVKDLFARIAPRYDLLNDLQSFGIHRRWKRRLVQLAKPVRGERALDLCCGTGDLALALASCGLDVTGLDFSEPMLAIARRRAAETSGPTAGTPVQFACGDALHVPFPDKSFDIITMGYGLRNLSDWRAGLEEMTRLLKPSGRVLVLEFGKPDNSLWRAMYFGYLRMIVPCLGWLFAKDASAYAYILESLQNYPAQHGVAAAMRELGLSEVRIVTFLGGVMTINYAQKRPA
jgi:demethylmenaquinone methyltransferase / 2-methoxy-6-polyprenyl-1,4-benzoquinol methylase